MRSMIQEGCSQEDYNLFKREWLRYVRFYKKVEANEIRDQLLNCLDRTLQLFVYRDLGSDVDTATQADLLWVIKLLVVEEVEKDVYENPDGKTDTHYPTNVVVVDEEYTVEMVEEDMKPANDDHESVNKETESRKDILPGHNAAKAANAGKTGLDGKVGGTRSDPPEV